MKLLRGQIEEWTVDFFAMISAIATTIVAITEGMTLSGLIAGPWEPLFITMAALTSLSLFNQKNWRIPSMMILLVAAFSAIKYPTLHYVFAAAFFLSSYIVIATSKRYSWMALTAIPAAPFLFIDLLIFEVIAIPSIAIFHMMHVIHQIRISSQRKKSKLINNQSDYVI